MFRRATKRPFGVESGDGGHRILHVQLLWFSHQRHWGGDGTGVCWWDPKTTCSPQVNEHSTEAFTWPKQLAWIRQLQSVPLAFTHKGLSKLRVALRAQLVDKINIMAVSKPTICFHFLLTQMFSRAFSWRFQQWPRRVSPHRQAPMQARGWHSKSSFLLIYW